FSRARTPFRTEPRSKSADAYFPRVNFVDGQCSFPHQYQSKAPTQKAFPGRAMALKAHQPVIVRKGLSKLSLNPTSDLSGNLKSLIFVITTPSQTPYLLLLLLFR